MGRGIASALLNRCFNRSREQDMEALRLEVSVENREAIRLYEDLGFSEIGRKGEGVLMKLAIGDKRQA